MSKRRLPISPEDEARIRKKILDLCAIGSPDRAIAYAVSMSLAQLRRTYRKELTKGRSQLRRDLRSAIIAKALAGDVGLLIQLEKQHPAWDGAKPRRP
jgi:DNA invertase Pin-like site-specific DNA recombinase